MKNVMKPRLSLAQFGDRKPPSALPQAFTLIELLVVMAIISLLAAMAFPVLQVVNRTKIRSRTRAELAQVANAIELYKANLGHYPPDNPGNPRINQLYYELVGTSNTGAYFITLDGSEQIAPDTIAAVFGNSINGFVNCVRAGGVDEGRRAICFLRGLNANQVGSLPGGGKILVSMTPWSTGNPAVNPVCYNSSNPTNNPNSYDLWIDVLIGGKVNRINNWTQTPLINP